jgi:hypothetical protein
MVPVGDILWVAVDGGGGPGRSWLG